MDQKIVVLQYIDKMQFNFNLTDVLIRSSSQWEKTQGNRVNNKNNKNNNTKNQKKPPKTINFTPVPKLAAWYQTTHAPLPVCGPGGWGLLLNGTQKAKFVMGSSLASLHELHMGFLWATHSGLPTKLLGPMCIRIAHCENSNRGPKE